jgi:hypothetical protein
MHAVLFLDNKMFAVHWRISLFVVACTQAISHILSLLKTYGTLPVAHEGIFKWQQIHAVAVLSYFQILFRAFTTKFIL